MRHNNSPRRRAYVAGLRERNESSAMIPWPGSARRLISFVKFLSKNPTELVVWTKKQTQQDSKNRSQTCMKSHPILPVGLQFLLRCMSVPTLRTIFHAKSVQLACGILRGQPSDDKRAESRAASCSGCIENVCNLTFESKKLSQTQDAII